MKTTVLVVLLLMLVIAPSASAVDALDRMNDAREVLIDIMAVKEDGIPRHILDRAHCIVIVPAAKRAGLGIGGSNGWCRPMAVGHDPNMGPARLPFNRGRPVGGRASAGAGILAP